MTAKHALTAFVSSLFIAAAGPALANTCASIDDAGAKQLFERWNTSLSGHNPDLVLEHYAKEHTFKPADGTAMTDRAAIRTWWNEYVDLTPKAVVESSNVRIDCNTVVKSGVKTLDTSKDDLKVAYEMEFQNQDGIWRITRHELNPVTN